ncbi:MAG: hypothetical protein RUDDFDWM_001324 [Candidatus Fervidibacterota bacterium]
MRKKPIVIGLTGVIASGKSEVSRMLQRYGAVVLNADTIGHEMLQRSRSGYGRVVGNFGTGILDHEGDIDRRKLAMCVFSDRKALLRLNSLLHPLMVEEISERIKRACGRGAKLVVVEAAVLFEMSARKLVDEVWVAHATKSSILKRLRGRGMKLNEALSRLASQISPNEFMRRANRVINCNESILKTMFIVSSAVRDMLLR